MSRNTGPGSIKRSGPAAEPKVYLAGFMGSGKSTVGPILADELGCPFVDLDGRIEAEAGLPIPEIFSRFGEPGFRRLESDVLRKAAAGEREVIALGGGAILDPRNLALVKNSGTLFYLKVPPRELARRLMDDNYRPLLDMEERDGAERARALLNRIESLLAAREPIYLRAHHIIEAGDRVPQDCAREILGILGDKNG